MEVDSIESNLFDASEIKSTTGTITDYVRCDNGLHFYSKCLYMYSHPFTLNANTKLINTQLKF